MAKILFIESESDSIKLAKETMNKYRELYEFHVCSSLKETNLWLKVNTPDTILANLNLPDGSALELLSGQEKDFSYPIIIIANQGNEHRIVEAMNAGAFDFIVKTPIIFHGLPFIISRNLNAWHTKQELQKAFSDSQKNEIFLKTILKTTKEGYALLDQKGFFLEVNPAYCKMIGFTTDELIGKHIVDLEALESPIETQSHINYVIEHGSDSFETRQKHKNGDLIDLEVSTTHLPVEGGFFVCFFRDVSERKLAEKALRDSETKYRQMVDTAYEGVWVFDETYHLVFVNQRMADLLGYTPAEMFAKKLDEFVSPDQFEDLRKRKQNRKSGQHEQFERLLVRKDGSQLWTLTSASPLFDEKGVYSGTFSMVTDISEQKFVEKALRFSESRFRQTFDFSPVGKALLDMDLKFIHCNQTFCEFVGYEEQELIEKSYLFITAPGDETIGNKEIHQLIRGEIDKFTVEKRYKRKDGSIVWGETSVNLITGEDGKTRYFLPVIQNIHDRKLTDEKLKEREAKLASIFRASPTGMGVTVNRVIIEVNRRLCELIGYSETELIGQNSRILYPSDTDYEVVGKEKYQQIAEQGVGTVETKWKHKDGHIINILLSSAPLDPQDLSKGVSFTALDITERTRFLRTLEESEARFREVVNASPNSIMVVQNGKYVYANPYVLNLLGYNERELIGMNSLSIIHPEDHHQILMRLKNIQKGSLNNPMVIKILHKNGYWMYAETVSVPIKFNNQPAALIISHDVNERIQQEEITNSRLHLLEYATKYSLEDFLKEALEEICRLTDSKIGFYHFINEDQNTIRLQVWSRETKEKFSTIMFDKKHYPIDQARIWDDCIRIRKPVVQNDFLSLPNCKDLPEGYPVIEREVVLPVIRGEKIVAVMGIGNKKINYNDNDVKTISQLADFVWDVAERKRVVDENQQQFEQLKLLHDINLTISLHIAQEKFLQLILERIVELGQIDAAALLKVENMSEINITHQVGLVPALVSKSREVTKNDLDQLLQISDTVNIFDLQNINPVTNYQKILQESYQNIIIFHLSTNSQPTNYLILLSTSRKWIKENWYDFLHSIALQTEVALENSQILHDLQDKNMELKIAYEAIIKGWSKALELRDKETQGHSERVTSLSLKLAKLCKFPEENLEDFRRGVLLHDIGKMGIPDSILLKPGPLSDDEWITMRQHPELGYQLLKEIPDFNASLDIPLAHHERWDGNGYPQGLSGEEIPLGARIFSIVDVWDALLDDRPYRPAWSKKSALEYIQKQSGMQFDPKIVENFIHLLKAEGTIEA